MVIIYEFRRTTNESGLSWGCTRRFKEAKVLKKPQPTKTTTTETLLKTGEELLQKNENNPNHKRQTAKHSQK
jgi:hypothetical protein